MRRRHRSFPRYLKGVRIGVPLVLASLAIGCNAILGWGELHKTPTGKGDDDDDTTSSSSSSGKAQSSGGGVDGSPASAACDPTKPFGAPVPVAGKVNTGSHETAPSLTADELTMFFQRTVGLDGGAILVSKRAKVEDEWGEAVELTELAQNQADYSPTVTADGLTLYWSELTTQTPRHEVIKIATRNTPTAPFSNVRVLDEVSNTTADDTTPSVAQDGSEIFFTSTRQGGNGQLFHSLRSVEGFATPTPLSELVSGTARDAQSALSADGLTIFFGSDRTGGLGQSDVWTATRPTKTAAFANITHLDGPVNTATIDWPTWVSTDGCRLYLGVLSGGAGDIVVATRGK
jgi:hypothetical protein